MSGDFYGLPTGILENEGIRLEYLAEAGPRLVRLHVAGSSENQLAEVPAIAQATAMGDFHLRGGHRLWTGPLTTDPYGLLPNRHVVVWPYAVGTILDSI